MQINKLKKISHLLFFALNMVDILLSAKNAQGSNLFITGSESIDVQTKLTYIQKVLIVNYDSCT